MTSNKLNLPNPYILIEKLQLEVSQLSQENEKLREQLLYFINKQKEDEYNKSMSDNYEKEVIIQKYKDQESE